MELTCNN